MPGVDDRVVLLLSGGLDSATLLAELAAGRSEVCAVTFDYGQRHAAEIAAATGLARRYGAAEHVVIRLDLRLSNASALLFGGPAVAEYPGALPTGPVETYVPMRNLVFVAHAAALAEARGIERVLLGFNKDDAVNYWDCSAAFVERANALLQLSNGAVRVEAPYSSLTKVEVAKRGRRMGVPLEETVTCYAPVLGEACGRCLACRIRSDALRA